MKILIIGPQGSGKGTQANIISKKFNIPHVSTGDAFREMAAKQTPIGLKAKTFWEKGNLVPDDITNNLVKERLRQDDCNKGFILDGYPRTLEQAKELDKNAKIDKVIELKLSDDEAIKRISSRRTCQKCGEVYNVVSNPPKKKDVCDKCGGKLVQRDDDTVEKIKKRLETYHNQTKVILEHYKSKVVSIDGSKGIDDISREIFSKL